MSIPEGTLIIIGGGEDKDDEKKPDIADKNKEFEELEILKVITPNSELDCSLEVITTATRYPEETGEMYRNAFTHLGFRNVNIMHIENKEQARDERIVERIKNATTIFFSGGDQFRIAAILNATPVMETITKRYYEEKDFTVAGTSAGAMAMPKIMLNGGYNNEAILKGDVKITGGLGLLDNCIVDTHFVKRGRFPRLAQVVITNPSCVGIGLGEDTAMMITGGNEMTCIGSGMVIIIDGHDIRYTNITEAESRTPICVENLIVHVIKKGNMYILNERKFIP
jgi:cyanophycinase